MIPTKTGNCKIPSVLRASTDQFSLSILPRKIIVWKNKNLNISNEGRSNINLVCLEGWERIR